MPDFKESYNSKLLEWKTHQCTLSCLISHVISTVQSTFGCIQERNMLFMEMQSCENAFSNLSGVWIAYQILGISMPKSPPLKGLNRLQLVTIVTVISLTELCSVYAKRQAFQQDWLVILVSCELSRIWPIFFLNVGVCIFFLWTLICYTIRRWMDVWLEKPVTFELTESTRYTPKKMYAS